MSYNHKCACFAVNGTRISSRSMLSTHPGVIVVEDNHFLLECPLYADIRRNMCSGLLDVIDEFD